MPVKPAVLDALRDTLAGSYTLGQELGQGGMATVYLAQDRDGHPVAMKVLRPELSSTVGAERFRREIRVAARLQHPNILGVLDSGVSTVSLPPAGRSLELLWFTMPFIEGRSVWERFEQQGPLPTAEVVRIGRAVATALAYAHGQGVVHRDIKPENILLEGDRVVVADFGLARAVDEVHDKLTATGTVMGSPIYMSPEQASGQTGIDGRSDIFSLACVLYELLSGKPPFYGATPHAALKRRFTGPPPKLRPMISVSEPLEAAILRALAREPAERFATADEFAAALHD